MYKYSDENSLFDFLKNQKCTWGESKLQPPASKAIAVTIEPQVLLIINR